MEKRKAKINNDIDLSKEEGEKEIYTFVIPNSSMNELNISVKKDDNKKKDKTKEKIA